MLDYMKQGYSQLFIAKTCSVHVLQNFSYPIKKMQGDNSLQI